MKILHCLRNFLPDRVAGTEIYVAGLCNELQNLGIEVVVINPSFGIEPKEYFYKGIRVKQYLETSLPSAVIQSGLIAPAGLANFKKLLLKEKPDAIHFHEMAGSNGVTIYHLMAAKEMGFPIFTTFHLCGNICMRNSFLYKGKVPCNGIIDEYKCAVCILEKKRLFFGMPEIASFFGQHFKKRISQSGIGKLFNYPLYVKQHTANLNKVNSLSEKMFVLSGWYKALLVSNGLDKHKIVVLPPAIAKPISVPALSAKNKIPDNNRIKFVYAGRITEIKGLHILLEALLNLKQQNWILDIYGAVSDMDYFKTCVQQTADNPLINWRGTIDNDKIISTLSEYDTLIFPSIVQETMGLIMLEAFAAGLPVIGSSIWSVKEQIKDGMNGLIFYTGDSFSLQGVLKNVLNDPSLLIKMAKNIKAPFYMDGVANITLSAYNEIIQVK